MLRRLAGPALALLLAALATLLPLSAVEAAAAAPGAAPVMAPGPAPTLDVQTIATVTVPLLNVRSGPGLSYAVLTQVSMNTALKVSESGGAWLHVTTPDGTDGWVSAALVTTAATAPADSQGEPTRIVAPTIGLNAQVLPAGWHYVTNPDGSTGADWDVPAFAAGWLINTSRPGQPGNTVLDGHHNILGEVFRYVVNLNVGDPITVFAGQKAYNYTVTDKFILPDKYVSYDQRVQNARWIGQFPDERLTLVTCWPYTNNTHRVIVIAHPS